VWFLFYGTFLLAVGAILFSIFCPWEIRVYTRPIEAANSESKFSPSIHYVTLLELEVRALEHKLKSQQPWLFRKHLGGTNNLYYFAAKDEATRVYNMIYQDWIFRNMERPILRITVLLIFWLGLTLITTPAIFTFIQVSWLAVNRFTF
jgi:hypothetical protein